MKKKGLYRWNGKSVLVTGAGGFIGSHLVERLLKLKAKVYCFLRYNSLSRKGYLEDFAQEERARLNIVRGDLETQETVMEAAKGMDVIFHLGALISVPYSFIHPQETFNTNAGGTLNILMAAREHGVSKVVVMSTSEVYGTAKYVPMDEGHPLQAQSPYAASKIAAEKLAESFFRSYRLPVAIARPFNTYGPRQSTRAVITTIISQALTRDELKLGNTLATRDFTYVEDTVAGLVRIAEEESTCGEVINLGSNFEIAIDDLVQLIAKVSGRDLRIAQDPLRIRPGTSEVQRLFASNEKAVKMLDWRPSVSLEEGIRRTMDWVRDNINHLETDRYGV
jgi:dTDP-glucose 4,6-dehydratase